MIQFRIQTVSRKCNFGTTNMNEVNAHFLLKKLAIEVCFAFLTGDFGFTTGVSTGISSGTSSSS